MVGDFRSWEGYVWVFGVGLGNLGFGVFGDEEGNLGLLGGGGILVRGFWGGCC